MKNNDSREGFVMRTPKGLAALLAVGLLALASLSAHAATVFTNTAVVNTATNNATFDAITNSVIPTNLNGYSEDGIVISVPDVSFVGFDAFNGGPTTGFHYGTSGNDSWVTITMVGGASITALDFLLGDGAPSSPTTNLIWETFQGLTSTGSGVANNLSKGTIVGWTDPAGFTSIRVAALVNLISFGDPQAIALDNVRITTAAPVPLPAAAWLLLSGLGGLGLLRKRKAA